MKTIMDIDFDEIDEEFLNPKYLSEVRRYKIGYDSLYGEVKKK